MYTVVCVILSKTVNITGSVTYILYCMCVWEEFALAFEIRAEIYACEESCNNWERKYITLNNGTCFTHT